MKLSIVIPVYNERAHFQELLARVRQAPLPEGMEREILIIDDGSTDGTSEALEAYRDGEAVRVYHSPVNCGKGTSVRIGIHLATGDLVLIQDADLEYDPDEYLGLLAPLVEGRADVVYGSRFLGKIEGMSGWHMLGNRILSWTSSVLFGTLVTDAYTCYKVMPLAVARDLGLRCRDFDIEAEITARALQKGYRLVEVPIHYYGRTNQEGKKIRKMDGFLGWLSLLRFRFLA